VGYTFFCCLLFLTIPFRPIISTGIGPIFAKYYAGLMEQNGCVDDRSEISFSMPEGTLPWRPIFVGIIHGIAFR